MECYICKDDKPDEELKKLCACKSNVLHESCVKGWIESSGRNDCAMCGKPFTCLVDSTRVRWTSTHRIVYVPFPPDVHEIHQLLQAHQVPREHGWFECLGTLVAMITQLMIIFPYLYMNTVSYNPPGFVQVAEKHVNMTICSWNVVAMFVNGWVDEVQKMQASAQYVWQKY